jgi:hypothetical protein
VIIHEDEMVNDGIKFLLQLKMKFERVWLEDKLNEEQE